MKYCIHYVRHWSAQDKLGRQFRVDPADDSLGPSNRDCPFNGYDFGVFFRVTTWVEST